MLLAILAQPSSPKACTTLALTAAWICFSPSTRVWPPLVGGGGRSNGCEEEREGGGSSRWSDCSSSSSSDEESSGEAVDFDFFFRFEDGWPFDLRLPLALLLASDASCADPLAEELPDVKASAAGTGWEEGKMNSTSSQRFCTKQMLISKTARVPKR